MFEKKSSSTKACTKIDKGETGLVSKSKNELKNKRGFRKTWHFLSLNSLFLVFGICRMVLRLIGSLLDHFDPQKN